MDLKGYESKFWDKKQNDGFVDMLSTDDTQPLLLGIKI